jgi:hypothetical protein
MSKHSTHELAVEIEAFAGALRRSTERGDHDVTIAAVQRISQNCNEVLAHFGLATVDVEDEANNEAHADRRIEA